MELSECGGATSPIIIGSSITDLHISDLSPLSASYGSYDYKLVAKDSILSIAVDTIDTNYATQIAIFNQ